MYNLSMLVSVLERGKMKTTFLHNLLHDNNSFYSGLYSEHVQVSRREASYTGRRTSFQHKSVNSDHMN